MINIKTIQLNRGGNPLSEVEEIQQSYSNM